MGLWIVTSGDKAIVLSILGTRSEAEREVKVLMKARHFDNVFKIWRLESGLRANEKDVVQIKPSGRMKLLKEITR